VLRSFFDLSLTGFTIEAKQGFGRETEPVRDTMDTFKRFLSFIGVLSALSLVTACSSGTDFNLDGDSANFQQSVTIIQTKVDILWVVDNSGSMETSQQNVADNFESFIQKFQDTQFDYQMAVTTTDAWLANQVSDPDDIYTYSRFRDGVDGNFSGVTVIKPDTPDLVQTFVTNISQGINGSGSERGFESLQVALSFADNLNEPFPRQDALLAIIHLTDEEDSSAQAPDPGNDPDWFADKEYYDFLYNLSGSTPDKLNFTYNTIGILDDDCLTQLATDFPGRAIAQRSVDMSEKTGGYVGSLCDDFDNVMAGIRDAIIDQSTAFQLGRQPILESMVVKVDGVEIPMDPENGWTYNPETMLVSFHGSAIPGPDAQVSIVYDPVGLL
jgi:hypothetical protein